MASQPKTNIANQPEAAPASIDVWLRGEEMTREGKGSGLGQEWRAAVALRPDGKIDLNDLAAKVRVGTSSGFLFVDLYFGRIRLGGFRSGNIDITAWAALDLDSLKRHERDMRRRGDGFVSATLGEAA